MRRTKIFSFIIILMCLFSLILDHNVLFQNGSNKITKKSNTNSTRVDQWILNLQANFNNPQWFYDNLNNTDRLMIRKAMDLAIPRDEIKANYFTTEQLLATPITPLLYEYYNADIPIEESLYYAGMLLQQVFGYKFSHDNQSTPYFEDKPYFPLTLTVDQIYPDDRRDSYISNIAEFWNLIGIATTIKYITQKINYRFINSSLGYDFDHGGLDAIAIGYTGGFFINLFDSNTKCRGDVLCNIIDLNDPFMDSLIINSSNSDPNVQLRSYMDFQNYYYDNVIGSMLFEETNNIFVNNAIKGFNPALVTNFDNISSSFSNSTLTIFSDNPFYYFNPLLQDPNQLDYYNLGGIYGTAGGPSLSGGGLFTFTTDQYLKALEIPYLLKDFNHTIDNLHWVVNLHQGLIWQDGYPITSDDIKFTYDSITNYGLPLISALPALISSNITILNSTSVRFDLLNPTPDFAKQLFQPLIPYHILSSVPYNSWTVHYTNLPNGTLGPIGYGPYKFKSCFNCDPNYNNRPSLSTTLTLEKWNNNSAILGSPDPVINEITMFFSYAPFTSQFNYQENLFNMQKELLINGTVDMFITNWPPPPNNLVLSFNVTQTSSKLYSYLRPFSQGIEYNLGSPIWGMNPINPSMTYPQTTTQNSTISTQFISITISTTVTASVTNQSSYSKTNNTPFGDLLFIICSFLCISLIVSKKRK